jgi:glycosyltransferase involved in cell wall biosynthesis
VKLIVQIPCFNEEETLPATFNDIPKKIDGVDQVEILIIDDGSTDKTIEVAKALGVHHIVINKNNRGLARTFRTGLNECLKLGADIIVNTDGDNQYAGWDIPKLIQPILDGKADLVVGDRNTAKVAHFSPFKKFLQRLGSYVVKTLSGVQVPDAVSGFRAYSRDAALQLNIVSPFSYTIEALIQAGKKHMAVTSVPVETNAKTRESRLFSSIPKFIERQLTTIVRMYAMYQPLKVFFFIGLTLSILGAIPILRFLYFYFTGDGEGHLQSLILGGVLTTLGFISFLIALLADLINFNRQLIEQTLEKVRRMELHQLELEKKVTDKE